MVISELERTFPTSENVSVTGVCLALVSRAQEFRFIILKDVIAIVAHQYVRQQRQFWSGGGSPCLFCDMLSSFWHAYKEPNSRVIVSKGCLFKNKSKFGI